MNDDSTFHWDPASLNAWVIRPSGSAREAAVASAGRCISSQTSQPETDRSFISLPFLHMQISAGSARPEAAKPCLNRNHRKLHFKKMKN